ncbi:MAG: acyl-CoA dehydrogenase family protein, partial [Candidatus Polarisedimenticolia bacterium]
AEDAAARDALARLAASDLLRYAAPVEGPASVRAVCAIRRELAWGSGLADAMFVMQGLGSAAIALEGSAAQRARWLPGVAAGFTIAAFALTEPEAGSDVGGISTRAVRHKDGWVLDGEKCYISNAGLAGLYTVFARTADAGTGPGTRGITAFAVDATWPGIQVSRLTVTAPHPIGRVSFSDCRVPDEARLGDEGSGYGLALRVLDRFRPTVGAAAAGFARRAFDESVRHAKGRRQFGKALADFQAIRFKLADMATALHASELLVWRAATMADQAAGGPAARRAAAMAKLHATESAQRIVDEAVQIHGGLGVTRGHVVERLYREVRALRVYEGTSEIQRLIIARSLLKEGPA